MALYLSDPRLQPTSGVDTGEETKARRLKIAAETKPAPSRVPAKAAKLLNFALSGEAVTNQISALGNKLLPGDPLGQYDDANSIGRFALDTFLSPIGLISTAAAPFTGGTSLGLRGAAGAAARVATGKVVNEAIMSAGAELAARGVNEVVPEDAPGWARAAAVLAGGVAGGATANRMLKKYVAQPGLDTLRVENAEIAASRATLGLKHLEPVPYMDTEIDYQLANQIGPAGLSFEGVRNAVRRAGATIASPRSNFSGPGGAIVSADLEVKRANIERIETTLAKLFPDGKQHTFQERGTEWLLPDGRLVPHQRVMETPDAAKVFNLNPDQALTVQLGREFLADLNALRASRGLPPIIGELEKGTDYWGHITVEDAAGNAYISAADRTKARRHKSVEDGMAAGDVYAPFIPTMKHMMAETLDEIRAKDFDDALSRYGVPVEQAVLDTKQGRIAYRRIEQQDRIVARIIDGIKTEHFRNKITIGQARSERNRLQSELSALEKHNRALISAAKTAAVVEFPPKRRRPRKGRTEELAAGREDVKAGSRAAFLGGSDPEDLLSDIAKWRALVNKGRMSPEKMAELVARRRKFSTELRDAVDGSDMRETIANHQMRIEELREGLKGARVTGGEVPKMLEKLKAARAKQEVRRKEWSAVRDARMASLPGGMFGMGMENIPVTMWRSKYYIPRTGGWEKLAERYNLLTGDAHQQRTPKFAHYAAEANNTMRYFASVADLSGMFINGLPLLATNPKAWAKMAKSGIQAMWDPAVQGRAIQKDWNHIQDMINLGNVSVGNIEVLQAVEAGGWVSKLEQMKATRALMTPLQRFQNNYSTSVLLTRLELWKTLSPVWRGDMRDLGKDIMKMTGGLDSAALGIGPTQRALESMVFFAPRMLRSTLALTYTAMRPWTEEGALALQTLARLTAVMAGTMALANLAAGYAAGETEEEIDRRMTNVLDPTKGRQFLSVPIGDHYYGVGGQFRGINQLIARALSDPKSLTEKDALDNPLIRFASGRMSPTAQSGLGAFELMTDEQHNVLPFESVDSFPDWVTMSATSGLPFFMQTMLDEKFNLTNPSTYASPFISAGAEVSGGRTAQFTPNDILNRHAQRRYGMDYADLTASEQLVIDELAPEAIEDRNQMGARFEKERRTNIENANTIARTELGELQSQLDTGRVDHRQYRMARKETLRKRAISLEQIDKDYGTTYEDKSSDSDKRRLLAAYNDTFRVVGGQVDWEWTDEAQAALMKQVDEGFYGVPARMREILEDRSRFSATTEVDDWFETNQDIIGEAGYWDTKDLAFEKVRKMAQNIDPRIESVQDLEMALSVARNTGDTRTTLRLAPVQQLLERYNNIAHTRMRRTNPRLERALLENGYITKVIGRGG